MNTIERLENWGRWASGRKVSHTCYSAEGGYHPPFRVDDMPTGWGDWKVTPPTVRAPKLDVLDALATERCMPYLPDKTRKVLKFIYVYRQSPTFCCRRLKLRLFEWDAFLLKSQNIFANRFTFENG